MNLSVFFVLLWCTYVSDFPVLTDLNETSCIVKAPSGCSFAQANSTHMYHLLTYAQTCTPSASPPTPDSECCGLTTAAANRLIIPGYFATLGEYPWMGLIEYEKDNKTKLLCSAILISGRYALSAAQCFSKAALLLGTAVNVRFGEYDTSNEGKDCIAEDYDRVCNDGAISIPIEKVVTHPEYNSKNDNQNDIALVKLASLVPYTDFIRPICLPTSDVSVNASKDLTMVVAGWGAVNSTMLKTDVLHRVSVPLVDFDTCQKAYTSRNGPKLGNGQLCAGGKDRDSCKGDSGGPLMVLNDRTKAEVAGIVSFGPVPCGLEGVPGVYTKVFAYDAWIRANIEK